MELSASLPPPPLDDDSAREPSHQQDLGLLGLVLLAQFHGVAADPAQLTHQYGRQAEPFSETDLLLAAKGLDLKARIIKQSPDRLSLTALPALALRPDGEHFIIARCDGDKVLIHDLKHGRPQVLSQAELAARYAGRLLLMVSRASAAGRWPSSTSPGSCRPSSNTASCCWKCWPCRWCCSCSRW